MSQGDLFSSCTDCRRYLNCRDEQAQPEQVGQGNYKKPKLVVITETPGLRSESRALLKKLLKRSKLKKKDIYYTAAVRCPHPDGKTPTKTEIRKCHRWLAQELDKIKPKYVLLLGNTPLESITGQKGIKRARGNLIEQDHRVYMPTYSPSFAIRDERMEPVLFGDILKLADVMKRGGARKAKGTRMKIIKTPKDLTHALNDIRDNSVVSFDTETSGLNPFAPGSWVTSLGVGTKKNQWCLPLQHPEGRWYDKPRVQRKMVQRVARALRGCKYRVAHSGKFDTKWLARLYNVWVDCNFDTMLAHYNLDENSLHSLEILSQRFLGATSYDIPLEEKHGFGPLDRHCEYLGLDVFYARKLFFKFNRWLNQEPATRKIFDHITMPASQMYAHVESTGVYLDQKNLEKSRVYWQRKADRSLAKLNKMFPSENKWKDKKTKEWMYGVNWNSPDQVAAILFDDEGLKPISHTPGGKRQVNESVLLQLKSKHKAPKLILDNREANKNLGTFVQAWQRKCFRSRMYPSFKIHGTVTGRPSCEDPNLQQTPRDPRLRQLLGARPGYTLMEADQSQAELRGAAEYSGDPTLTFGYQSGGVDVHTQTVQRIFGIMKPTYEERKKGKAINFGFLYGMGWRKFIQYALDNYGVVFSPAEAQRIRRAFFKLYPGLLPWHARQRKFATRNGFVRSLLGRKRRLPAALADDGSPQFHEAGRQAINSPVQSLASDLTLTSAVEVHKAFKSHICRVVGTVHDAILMEVRNDKVMEVAREVKRIMEAPKILEILGVELGIPLVADVSVGNWGVSEEIVFT